jgi:hypothetical protein
VSVLAAGAPDAGKDTHRHAVCVLLLLAHRVVAARAGAAAQLENRIPPGPARQEETVHRTLFHAAGYLFKRSAGACQDVVTAPTIIHSPLPGHGGGLFDSMSAHCQPQRMNLKIASRKSPKKLLRHAIKNRGRTRKSATVDVSPIGLRKGRQYLCRPKINIDI